MAFSTFKFDDLFRFRFPGAPTMTKANPVCVHTSAILGEIDDQNSMMQLRNILSLLSVVFFIHKTLSGESVSSAQLPNN